jgi:hypothetical protein
MAVILSFGKQKEVLFQGSKKLAVGNWHLALPQVMLSVTYLGPSPGAFSPPNIWLRLRMI